MTSHLMKHLKSMKNLRNACESAEEELISCTGRVLSSLIKKIIYNILRRDCLRSLATKNNKIRSLVIENVVRKVRIQSYVGEVKENVDNLKIVSNIPKSYTVPVLNLSNTEF